MATVNGLLGRKVGMTQVFDAESGKAIPVTVIECGPCAVVQRKTEAKDGYDALQLGYVELKTPRKDTKVSRGESGRRGRGEANGPKAGHFEKNGGAKPTRHLSEFRLIAQGDEPQAGGTRSPWLMCLAWAMRFACRAPAKGAAFRASSSVGALKGRKPRTVRSIHRKPASNGATDPARTFPGVKRPGRYGNDTITQLGLSVVEIDTERNLLIVKGARPRRQRRLVENYQIISQGRTHHRS